MGDECLSITLMLLMKALPMQAMAMWVCRCLFPLNLCWRLVRHANASALMGSGPGWLGANARFVLLCSVGVAAAPLWLQDGTPSAARCAAKQVS